MTLKIYGGSVSTCTSRVLATLFEKEVKHELIPVDVMGGEHKQPAFLAKNPFGQIPAMEDDGLTLFESRAISAYVSYKYKDQGTDLIRSNNVKEAGLVCNWVEVESQHYNPAIAPLVAQLVFMPFYGKSADQAIVDEHVVKLEKVLDVYEARLSNNKYLAGNFFSLADLYHFPYTYYLMKTQSATLINSRPHVKAWWEAVLSRPAIKKVAEGMTIGDK